MADFVRPAGGNSFRKSGGTAKDCLVFDNRPPTPPRLERFRKSRTTAPGVRFQHHGTVDDYQALHLDNLTFGESSNKGQNTAASLIGPTKKIGVADLINVAKAEAVYRVASREPLGQSLNRGTDMPVPLKQGKDNVLCLVLGYSGGGTDMLVTLAESESREYTRELEYGYDCCLYVFACVCLSYDCGCLSICLCV